MIRLYLLDTIKSGLTNLLAGIGTLSLNTYTIIEFLKEFYEVEELTDKQIVEKHHISLRDIIEMELHFVNNIESKIENNVVIH